MRRVSRRIDSNSEAAEFTSPDLYYRKHYFELVDCTVSAVVRRFAQPGMELAVCMESLILHGANGDNISDDDIELNTVIDFLRQGCSIAIPLSNGPQTFAQNVTLQPKIYFQSDPPP